MSDKLNAELIKVAFDIGAALACRLIDMVLNGGAWSPIIDLLPNAGRAQYRQVLARAEAKARLERTRRDVVGG